LTFASVPRGTYAGTVMPTMTDKAFKHLSADAYLRLSLGERLEYIRHLADELKSDIDRSGSHAFKPPFKAKPRPKKPGAP